MAIPGELGGVKTAVRSTVPGRVPTVAPTGAPRQVRQGDYIVTYSPSGSIISRVYAPISTSTQSGNRSESQVASRSTANQANRTNTLSNLNAGLTARTNNIKQTTNGLFGGSPTITRSDASGGSSFLGGAGSAAVGAASNMGSPDVYDAGTTGAGNTGGSANSSGYENANSGLTYTGAFKGIDDKQADYMVANPLAIAQKVFGLDMANNPTIAGLLSPILEAAQNPYIGAMLNPGQTGAPDQNNELNFAANLLKQYTTPGGSFLSPTAGLQGIQSAMGNPNSALNAVLSTATGDGAAGAAAQYDLFTKLMAPFLSLGTGAWGSDIFDSVGYDAYNKYTLGEAANPGLPKQDFLSYLMGMMGYPGTLK